MNSPFIQQQAGTLAADVEHEANAGASANISSGVNPAAGRVALLYRRVLGRSPQPSELELGTAFLEHADAPAGSLSPVAQLAQVLMLTNEFLFVD